jgi:hypothetical protein
MRSNIHAPCSQRDSQLALPAALRCPAQRTTETQPRYAISVAPDFLGYLSVLGVCGWGRGLIVGLLVGFLA